MEYRVSVASPRTLECSVRLLSPKQTLDRTPGWTFAGPATSNDVGTFARRLIWSRYRDEQIDMPVEVEWCEGLRIELRVGNDASWSVFVGGEYEPNEIAFLAATLKPGMTLVDVGANEGLFTLVAALRVGDSGRVLALEPSSREFQRLQKNIDLNGLKNVEPLRLALYDHSGHANLSCAEFGHEGLNAIGDRIANAGVAVTGSETVELETLDTLVAARGVDHLDFIKVDAEGSEARILEGAIGTVNRFQPVILLEIEPENLAAQGSTTDGLLELVARIGYRTWVFDSQGQPRLRSSDSPLSTNVIAAPLEWQPPNVP